MSEEAEIRAAVARLEKPEMWAPCNGCGKCCTLEVCHVGEAAFGPDTPAPCPAMDFDGERFRCGLMVEPSRFVGSPPEADEWIGELVRKALGVGEGCGCP